MPDTLHIEIYRRHGKYTVQLVQLDDQQAGHGYRLAGPKLHGQGELVLSQQLTERDDATIRTMLDTVFPSTTPLEG